MTHVKVYWISEKVWGSVLGHLTLFEEREKYLDFPSLKVRHWVFEANFRKFFFFPFLTLSGAE